MLTRLPTLKRGANNHCAYGAIEIGIKLVNKMESCDCLGRTMHRFSLRGRPAIIKDEEE